MSRFSLAEVVAPASQAESTGDNDSKRMRVGIYHQHWESNGDGRKDPNSSFGFEYQELGEPRQVSETGDIFFFLIVLKIKVTRSSLSVL
jgi:hypothetical protein